MENKEKLKEESKYPVDQYNGADKDGNLDMSLSCNKTLDEFLKDIIKDLEKEEK